MASTNNGKADLAFAVIILVFSAVIYWQTLDLPPPRYEPLGSAAVPQALCVIMSLLALVVLVRALVGRSKTKASSPAIQQAAKQQDTGDFIRRPWLAVGAFLLSSVYIAAMDLKLLAFIPATILFLALLGLLLTRGVWRQLPWIIGFSCALTVSCHLIFTKVFYIDLP